MKKILFTALIAIFGFGAQAQVAQNREVSGFSKIYVRDGIEVILSQGKEESVRVVSQSGKNQDDIITKSDGNTLKIYLDNESGISKTSGNITVYITKDELKGLKAGSGAAITVDGEFKTKGFALDMAAGATFKGKINAQGAVKLNARSGSVLNGVVTADLIDGNFTGGSTVKLGGFCKNAKINAASGATCLAPNLVCDKAVVDATDFSTVTVNVKYDITASADNTATISYYGNPARHTLGANSYAVARK